MVRWKRTWYVKGKNLPTESFRNRHTDFWAVQPIGENFHTTMMRKLLIHLSIFLRRHRKHISFGNLCYWIDAFVL